MPSPKGRRCVQDCQRVERVAEIQYAAFRLGQCWERSDGGCSPAPPDKLVRAGVDDVQNQLETVSLHLGRVLHGDGHMCHDWPKPPIWPEDLPMIRELLTPDEFGQLYGFHARGEARRLAAPLPS